MARESQGKRTDRPKILGENVSEKMNKIIEKGGRILKRSYSNHT